jgi:hypothetical protein
MLSACGERHEHREENFLVMAHDAIYAVPDSPYRRLLGLAGCEYGDLVQLGERGVRRVRNHSISHDATFQVPTTRSVGTFQALSW